MNLDDSPEEAAYRLKVRSWIQDEGPDLSRYSKEDLRDWTETHKEIARSWQAVKTDAGYGCINWPVEHGGAGGTTIEATIFAQEELAAGLRFNYFRTGLEMLLPALLRFADAETCQVLVPPAVRGDTIWCQLFSEPSSGSDSAAVRTAAVRDGDDWVINGQKVWNSGAHIADYGLLMTRTDPSLPKHKGLTAFWVKMDQPGIEVRPIMMMSGDAELNEVFLTDLRVSDAQRVGAVGDGWNVIISTLMNERAAIGAGGGLGWADIMKIARDIPGVDGPAIEDPAFREWLADWYVNAEGIRLLSFQTLTSLSRGQAPGPESSAGKLLWANQTQDLSSMALDVMGHFGLIDQGDEAIASGAFQHRFLWAPGLRLGGGSDEIMKNIIAERILGLPGDPRVDKNVAFKDIPKGR